MSWETVAAIASMILAIGTLAAFVTQAIKTGEEKGRLMQRVDELERKASGLSDRIACVEDGHSDSRTQFATFEERLKGIDDKLGVIMNQLDRRERPRGD